MPIVARKWRKKVAIRDIAMKFSVPVGRKHSPNRYVESFCSCKLLPNLYIGRNQGLSLALPSQPESLISYRSRSTFVKSKR
jgi:hypothetical protein